MKNLYIALLCLATSTFTSCEKNKNEEDNPLENGKITFKMDHKWGNDFSTSVVLNKYFVHPGTQDSIKFDQFKYYISNIQLQQTNNTWVKAPESYHLVNLVNTPQVSFNVENIPSGEYKAVKFILGVDSTRNVSGAQTGALAVENGMFWSWNTGYIFLRAEGFSPSIPEENSNRFVYHFGGFSGVNNAIQQKTFEFEQILSINPQAKPSLHLKINVARIWHGGIKLADRNKVHMPGENAKNMMANFADGIILDHTHR